MIKFNVTGTWTHLAVPGSLLEHGPSAADLFSHNVHVLLQQTSKYRFWQTIDVTK